MERAILQAIAEGNSTTSEIVSTAHKIIQEKNYSELSFFLLRLVLLRLLQRDEYIKKQSATSYVITPAGKAYLLSPYNSEQVAANYVRNLIKQVRK